MRSATDSNEAVFVVGLVPCTSTMIIIGETTSRTGRVLAFWFVRFFVLQLAVESTAGVYPRGGISSSIWSRYFSDDPVTQASLLGVRLRRSGRLYSFVHKSVPEYFAACAMWADVMAVSAAVKLSAPRGPQRQLTVDKAADGSSAPLSSQHGDCILALNRIAVSNQPAVLAFMVDMLAGLPVERTDDGHDGALGGSTPSDSEQHHDGTVTYYDAVAGLEHITRMSAVRHDVDTASSNCASVLAQAGVILYNSQWDNVCLKNAVLSDAVMLSVSLRGANLSGSNLERVTADSSSFFGANLDGVTLGQYEMLEGHTGPVRGLAISSDGSTVASCGKDGKVWLWTLHNEGRTAAALDHSGSGGKVACVAFYPNGSALVSSCKQHGFLRVWTRMQRPGGPSSAANRGFEYQDGGMVPLDDDSASGSKLYALSLAVSAYEDTVTIAAGLSNGDLRLYRDDGRKKQVVAHIPRRYDVNSCS